MALGIRRQHSKDVCTQIGCGRFRFTTPVLNVMETSSFDKYQRIYVTHVGWLTITNSPASYAGDVNSALFKQPHQFWRILSWQRM